LLTDEPLRIHMAYAARATFERRFTAIGLAGALANAYAALGFEA
jgi:hypothetical protein